MKCIYTLEKKELGPYAGSSLITANICEYVVYNNIYSTVNLYLDHYRENIHLTLLKHHQETNQFNIIQFVSQVYFITFINIGVFQPEHQTH